MSTRKLKILKISTSPSVKPVRKYRSRTKLPYEYLISEISQFMKSSTSQERKFLKIIFLILRSKKEFLVVRIIIMK